MNDGGDTRNCRMQQHSGDALLYLLMGKELDPGPMETNRYDPSSLDCPFSEVSHPS
jgi:hypothetical protein